MATSEKTMQFNLKPNLHPLVVQRMCVRCFSMGLFVCLQVENTASNWSYLKQCYTAKHLEVTTLSNLNT